MKVERTIFVVVIAILTWNNLCNARRYKHKHRQVKDTNLTVPKIKVTVSNSSSTVGSVNSKENDKKSRRRELDPKKNTSPRESLLDRMLMDRGAVPISADRCRPRTVRDPCRPGETCSIAPACCCIETKGMKGDQGDRGDTGRKGDRGNVGPSGIPGRKGERGTPGFDGDIGAKGDRGLDGTPGLEGAPGTAGLPGVRGNQGPPGFRGPEGDKGGKGNAGRDGIPGAKGQMGTPGLPGLPGSKGLKGVPGPYGPKGDTGIPGCPGKPGVCDCGTLPPTIWTLPPIRRTTIRPPSPPSSCCAHIYTVHSQHTAIPPCKRDHISLWEGYSYLHSEDDGRTHTQDLGEAGSCLQIFDPMPFLNCDVINKCSLSKRTATSFWLSSGKYTFESMESIGPFKCESSSHGMCRAVDLISRCRVCVAPRIILAIHSHNNSIPNCPPSWTKLWHGYSFQMHSVAAMGGGQPLSSPGSCLEAFHPINYPFYVECTTHKECTFYKDEYTYWLHDVDGGKTRPLRNIISRCAVCMMS